MNKLYCPIGSKVYVTQWHGERPEVYGRFGMDGHNGIDFRTKFSDTPLGRRYTYAVTGGIIEMARVNGGYGLEVRLRDAQGRLWSYGHHHSIKVKEGQKVNGGFILGITGNTGFSSGPHLHFGVRPKNPDFNNGCKGWADPMIYLGNGMIDPETGLEMRWDGRRAVSFIKKEKENYKELYKEAQGIIKEVKLIVNK